AQGADEWQVTFVYSQYDSVISKASATAPLGKVSLSVTSRDSEVTEVKATGSADAVTFNDVKLGAKKGDVGWVYGGNPRGDVSASGAGSFRHHRQISSSGSGSGAFGGGGSAANADW